MLYSTGQIGGFLVEGENLGALSLASAAAVSAPRFSAVALPNVSAAPIVAAYVPRAGVRTTAAASRPIPQLAPQQGVDLRAPDPAPAPKRPIRLAEPRTSVSASSAAPARAAAAAVANQYAKPSIVGEPARTGSASGLSSGTTAGSAPYYSDDAGGYQPEASAGPSSPSSRSPGAGAPPAGELTQGTPEGAAVASFFEANKVAILGGGAALVGVGLLLAFRK